MMDQRVFFCGSDDPTYTKNHSAGASVLQGIRNRNTFNADLVRRAAAWSLVAFVLSVCLLLPISLHQYQRNRADLAAATQVQAVETAVRLQQEIDHHLKLLEMLRDKLQQNGTF